jgi:hypothetical protein
MMKHFDKRRMAGWIAVGLSIYRYHLRLGSLGHS